MSATERPFPLGSTAVSGYPLDYPGKMISAIYPFVLFNTESQIEIGTRQQTAT